MSSVMRGLRLCFKRWKNLISVAILCACVTAVLAIVLTDVVVEIGALRGGTALREIGATYFTSYYEADKVVSVNDVMLNFIKEQIRAKKAYSSVLFNLSLNDSEAFEGINTGVVVGEKASDIFPYLEVMSARPQGSFVLRGTQVEASSDTVNFKGKQIPVVQYMPRSSTWFDPHLAGLNLDDKQLIFLDPDDLGLLDPEAQEELVTRMIFIQPQSDTVDRYISLAKSAGLYLVPSDLREAQDRGFIEILIRAGMYIIAIAAFIILAIFSYTASIREIIAYEMRNFVIRRMCGARSGSLAVEIITFTAISMLVVPFIMCVFVMLLGYPFDEAGFWALLTVLALYVIVVVCALRVVRTERSRVI